jgi:engulfment/cell motility protein 1
VLFYGDCEDDQIPSIEHLPHKLPIVDIRSFVTGRDCPHMKDAKSKKSTFQLAFSLLTESDDQPNLNFVAPDERTYNYWIDGLNALLGNSMTSKEVEVDLELLLGMEMKLKLLETEGYEIPDAPPDIPPPVPLLDLNAIVS